MTMTQEEKELLLKDLCSRLPYGTKFAIGSGKLRKYDLVEINVKKGKVQYGNELYVGLENCKPYLRPMSSMTKEESKEYFSICTGSIRGDMIAKIDFYIKHHFDFRLTSEGLSMIEAGLALEAPEDMYK